MALCLTHPKHGYYMTRDPFGAAGDFITAPEISQMFGELIGLWAAAVWRMMGAPENVRLVELGPGRGTMMGDALRAATGGAGLSHRPCVHLVEISPALQQLQRETLERLGVPMLWHKALDEVPDGPGHHPRQRILRRAAGASGDQAGRRLARARGGARCATAISRSASLLAPVPHFDRCCRRSVRDAPVGCDLRMALRIPSRSRSAAAWRARAAPR